MIGKVVADNKLILSAGNLIRINLRFVSVSSQTITKCSSADGS